MLEFMAQETPPRLGTTSYTLLGFNIDGSSLGNPGIAGAGGVLRNHNGNWLADFNRHIGLATNNMVEFWGLRDGLNMAPQLNYSHVIIETHIQVMLDLLNAN
ncbi:hypothetical protein ACH5RR_013387 [Cinchona calisaya]|uniref:RNase H type-1 domain-containing protein n=1 Tax=Cinchona calisaya TaxID=153742 RepID=A0ABD3A398_9GENT